MAGTSIEDLKKHYETQNYNSLQNQQYNANQNLQYEQGHNAAHNIIQAQQDPYYNMSNVNNYPQNPSISPHITELTNSITNNLQNSDDINNDILDELSKEPFDTQDSKQFDNLFFIVFAIVLAVYIILSLPVTRINVGKIITLINPDKSGNVSMSGIFIYGIIMALLVAFITKYFLTKKK